MVDAGGNAYVNTIGFDFPGGEPAPGSVALVTPTGDVRRVADDLAFPNGMAITGDGSTLIVAESHGNRLTAYDIGPDGDVANRRTWADTGDDHPDGICIDAEGAVWYADVANRHCVRVREGGEVLATVELDRGASPARSAAAIDHSFSSSAANSGAVRSRTNRPDRSLCSQPQHPAPEGRSRRRAFDLPLIIKWDRSFGGLTRLRPSEAERSAADRTG